MAAVLSLSFLQFYLVGLLVVLVVSHLGDWVPTALVLQLLGRNTMENHASTPV